MIHEDEDRFDDGFVAGEASATRGILNECFRRLNPSERDNHSWLLERSAAISALRSICRQLGQEANDWPDDLHLADIISNYVAPFIDLN